MAYYSARLSIIVWAAIFSMMGADLNAGTILKSNTFIPGTVISSSQINSNFDQLFTELNAKETRLTTLESGGGSLWSVNGTSLYYNGGNVGVGTATPGNTLEVVGGISMQNAVDNSIVLRHTGANGDEWHMSNLAGIGSAGGLRFYNADNTSEYMRIGNSGNVGIGTINPGRKLTLTATAGSSQPFLMTTNDYVPGTTGSVFVMEFGAAAGNTYSLLGALSAGGSAWNNLILQLGGNVGIGDLSPDTTLKVNGSLCVKSDANNCFGAVAGTIYANNTTVQGADYAEYFLAEEKLKRGEVVGLNANTGLARGYKSGDKLLGIVSTNPGVTGNSEIKEANSVLVALMGQVPVNQKKVKVEGALVSTFDGIGIGYLLSNGNIYINISSTRYDYEKMKRLEKDNLDLREAICEINPRSKICHTEKN